MSTPNPTPEPAPPVVIAGSAGLATAAAALQQRGAHAVILKRGSGVTTSWRNRHGELLPLLRRCTVTPRRVLLATAVDRWVGRAMARILPADLHDVFEPHP